MKIITLEEHIHIETLSSAFAKYHSEDADRTACAGSPELPYFPDMKLYCDIEARLADMDKNGIERQILSAPVSSGLLKKEEAAAVVRSERCCQGTRTSNDEARLPRRNLIRTPYSQRRIP